MTDLFKKTRQFVIESFNKASLGEVIKHLERTVYWIERLSPNADEALLIAGISHDIEKANRNKIKERPDFSDKEFLRYHQEGSARIIGKFLESQNAQKELTKKVKILVAHHEDGENDGQNLLKDADSISFFENVEDFLNKKRNKISKEKMRQKIDYMYNRITSKKAREIAKQLYEHAVKELEKF